jgi:hypothetical protein
MYASIVFGFWVTVLNPEGISNVNRHLPFWESCVITHIQLTEPVMPYDEDLTLYRVTDPREVGGSACPQGTLFQMEPAKWDERRQGEAAWEDRRKQAQKKMEQLLKQR